MLGCRGLWSGPGKTLGVIRVHALQDWIRIVQQFFWWLMLMHACPCKLAGPPALTSPSVRYRRMANDVELPAAPEVAPNLQYVNCLLGCLSQGDYDEIIIAMLMGVINDRTATGASSQPALWDLARSALVKSSDRRPVSGLLSWAYHAPYDLASLTHVGKKTAPGND
ncbi:hypothetical protein BJX63DRAFT_287767 [Aspergillus granulosus]|uniref:Uncharacterized protein n=1 Tax=Aspergillus granulosus TaxID=176169 RepID=A0ABR4H6U9_9EURO